MRCEISCRLTNAFMEPQHNLIISGFFSTKRY